MVLLANVDSCCDESAGARVGYGLAHSKVIGRGW
ncbi:hypothetical protein Ae168Ps1_5051c [Pseudonocardia sp. Ae168_Ps1]|nr:hypothetical protein Ae168Ps1_5051c [Pseudonocardia sp. Ae168_Ps1]